jgi:hypothetical protein
MKSLSDSNAHPVGENSRRDFRQKLGAVAAVAPVAVNTVTPAAANAATAQSMPMVRFGKHMISRLIIGCKTLGNLSHLSRFIDLEMRQ